MMRSAKLCWAALAALATLGARVSAQGVFNSSSCTIYVVRDRPGEPDRRTITTLVLGNPECPADQFAGISEADVAARFPEDFIDAVLFGPFTQVFNGGALLGEGPPAVRYPFPSVGLIFIDIGSDRSVDLLPDGSVPLGDALTIVEPFVPVSVVRGRVAQFWFPGQLVFRLVDPEGFIFTMTVQSNIVDPALRVEDLPTLADRLSLPPGWSYYTEVLTALFTVAGEVVFSVRDDFQNQFVRSSNAQSSLLCSDGIVSSTGSVCCAAECGACGGCNCGALPGDAAACCPNVILDDGVLCISSSDVACVIDATISRPPNSGTGCTD